MLPKTPLSQHKNCALLSRTAIIRALSDKDQHTITSLATHERPDLVHKAMRIACIYTKSANSFRKEAMFCILGFGRIDNIMSSNRQVTIVLHSLCALSGMESRYHSFAYASQYALKTSSPSVYAPQRPWDTWSVFVSHSSEALFAKEQ